MGIDVQSKFAARFEAVHTDDSGPDLSATHLINLPDNREFGTGDTQIDGVYSSLPLTLAVSTPVTLDLTSLTDAFGSSFGFSQVFRVMIVNKSTIAGDILTVGAAASNIWEPFAGAGETITIPPAGAWAWADGNGATADATNKNLKLDPGAKTFDIDLIIIGTKV